MIQALDDQLEVVEVEEEHSHRRGVPLRPLQCLLHPVAEQRAVGQTGQRVVQGLMGKLLLRPPTLGHVVHRDDGTERPAVPSLDRPAVAQQCPRRAVLRHYHQLGVAHALPS